MQSQPEPKVTLILWCVKCKDNTFHSYYIGTKGEGSKKIYLHVEVCGVCNHYIHRPFGGN